MARARTLKPGFFTNDLLAECEPLARILFQGLWCHADRAGRLAFRPKKIKAEILPYDDADVEKLLLQLQAKGFLDVYEVANTQYLQIVNFAKHQSPHMKEPESTIPAPDEHQTKTSAVPDEHNSSRALTLNPLPVSLNPLPVSINSIPAPRKRVASLSAEQSKLFDEWWQVWPVKQGKEPAKLAFLAALSRGATVLDLTAGARRYAEVLAAPDPPRPKFPQGWLNDSRWLDEIMPNGHANGRTDGSGGISGIQPIQPSGPRSPPPKYILPPH